MKNDFTVHLKQDDAHHSLKNKLLSNFSWLFAGTFGKILLRFIATLYLARVLSPLGFGQIAFAQVILAYFILFIDSGLEAFGTREIAASSEDRSRIVDKILTIRFVLIIVSLIILLTFAPLFTPSAVTKNLLIVYSFVLIPIGLNLNWFFRGIEKMMLVAVSDLLQIGLYLALIILVVKSPEQILFVPIIFIAGHMLSTLFFSGIYTHRWRLPKLYLSIKDNWQFLRSAIPVVTILIFFQIYYNLDTLMLGFFRGEREVGLYNAAYRLIMGIITLSAVLMESVYPAFSRLYQKRPLEVSKLLKKTLTLSMVVAIPIGIAGTILSGPIMVTLFGSAFSDSKFALQILVWSAALVLFAANYGYCLVACHQQKALAISIGIGAAANIALNFLLIPSYGIMGASLATVIAQFTMLIFQIAFFYRRIYPTLPSAASALKAFVAGLSMVIVILYLNPFINFYSLLFIGTVIYFLILWLLGGIPLHILSSFRRG